MIHEASTIFPSLADWVAEAVALDALLEAAATAELADLDKLDATLAKLEDIEAKLADAEAKSPAPVAPGAEAPLKLDTLPIILPTDPVGVFVPV